MANGATLCFFILPQSVVLTRKNNVRIRNRSRHEHKEREIRKEQHET